jgi:hypothetical protein|tara:strand:- start:3055 stop:3882 length:828 start_codon:yes stop_codon:yes gene_type:complete
MNSKLNINDTKNYCKHFNTPDVKTYLSKYIELINEYLINVIENMIIQDEIYFIFLIKRGIQTINHCFHFLLTYTKNLDLTIYHCKKAIYYYVEFIGQISDISISHSYLQLNSKDAILFVYKKTIYDINTLYRKNMDVTIKDEKFIKKLSTSIELFNNVIIFLLQKEKLKYNKKENLIHYSIEKSLHIIYLLFDYKKEENIVNKNEICLFFFQILQTHDISNIKYINICDIFIKKIHKINNLIELKSTIPNKLYDYKCKDNLNKLSALRFVNWLIG